jgi:hypothetical protein
MYLIGGTHGETPNIPGSSLPNTKRIEVLEIFSPSSASVRTLDLDACARRNGAAGAVLGQSIYICGGDGSTGSRTSCVRLHKDDGDNINYKEVCLEAVE